MADLGLEHFFLASLLFLSDYRLVLCLQQIAVDLLLSRRMILERLARVLQASDLLGVCCQAKSLLEGSENHPLSVPHVREPRCGIGPDTPKTIALQCSLAKDTQA